MEVCLFLLEVIIPSCKLGIHGSEIQVPEKFLIINDRSVLSDRNYEVWKTFSSEKLHAYLLSKHFVETKKIL